MSLKTNISVIFLIILLANDCFALKILAVFPYNGRSHHILFSSLVEELSNRNHDVTVVNYFPLKNNPHLRQISIQDSDNSSDLINVEDHVNNLPSTFTNFYRAYDAAMAFNYMANINCEKVMLNKELQELIASKAKYDLVIAEQFMTDCGLAIGYKLNAPTVGMTAHILMPWTYSRLGASNNPAFVPNGFFNSGSKPHLWNKIQSGIINLGLNLYYRNVIQKENQLIVNKIYPDVPDLETLGRNMCLIMVNQYFPLTGSRLYGNNVVEVGGLHINEEVLELRDKDVKTFLDNAKNGVVYISFGTVASYFPRRVLNAIIQFIEETDMNFIWKIDNITNWVVPRKVLVKKWLSQSAILCHENVKAFITHSGMLSSTEAMHCGVPIVSVPIFGDQLTNAGLAVENGLGVTVDILTLNEVVLKQALDTVLQQRYQNRAKQLSRIWRDRPMSPMDTAIYWIEYTARHKGAVEMKPATVNLPIYQYLLLDVYFVFAVIIVIIIYLFIKIISCILNICKNTRAVKKIKSQ